MTGCDVPVPSSLAFGKPQMILRSPSQDTMVYQSVVLDNEYQLPATFDQHDVILDGGAHIGCFAVACLERGAGFVSCWEPNPSNFELLKANLQRFDQSRWEATQACLWNSTQPAGDTTFSVFPMPFSAMSHAFVPEDQAGASSIIRVPTQPFDEVVQRLASHSRTGMLRLVKLDIEGSE